MNNIYPRLTLQDAVAILKDQGIVTVEGVFSAEEMKIFRDHLDETITEVESVEEYKGRPTEKLLAKSKDTIFLLWELYAVCEKGLRFTRHPVILNVLENTLGEPVKQASIGTMFDKVAGGDAEISWHQDTFFIVDPPKNKEINLENYWTQFGHVHIRPTDINWQEDYFLKTIIVRINVDPQTIDNGAMKILPGSHLQGPLELTGGLNDYINTHENQAIDCIAGEGSVTFYFPTTIHSSEISQAKAGIHRRAAAHRVRAASLEIPGWEWPTNWPEGMQIIEPESDFDLNPFA
tara:strand:+ start:31418 stop:32290 length:873 start_codon:yes stop_codon:yes gene_type:complete